MIKRISDKTEIGNLLSVNGSPAVRDRVLSIVASSQAILQGHFQLQGGDHSEYLIRFRQIGRDPDVAQELARMLLPDATVSSGSVVVCPESSGYFLGRAIAELTGGTLTVVKIDHSRRPTSAVRTGNSPTSGDRVIIVNDVFTSGRSLRPLMDLVVRGSATADRLAVFGTLKPALLQKFANDSSLTETHLVSALWSSFSPAECPLCSEGSQPLPAAEFN